MTDEFDLQRFVDAQDPVYDTVVAELRTGRKRSHWMWFIFPQLAGLGRSEMAQRYAIRSADEAAAYLAHPVLGARLRECAGIVVALDADTIEDVFGTPDDMKFHSSMTLFADVAPDEAVFQGCIDRWFDGAPDRNTLALL
ncbi:DUF1810 domain-containing protein [Massilia sp. IC2-477]|uniref:DUF1810 domain-containing protein n=1 Tax=Massilia sp. IC2-477 TaxID=2887198 RepID=UPI001D0F9727|nr:DUF1810 domain-containing protein [Massilia sp. IC2-477]MCC2955717.1 DUF1810 domain-containing protein [Massilia sp. IC2-477]